MKLTAAVLAALLLPVSLHGQAAGFVTMIGTDTIASETFTLTPTSLMGALTIRITRAGASYDADLRDWRVSKLRVQGNELTSFGDTVPFINLAFSFIEIATRRMVAEKADSMAVPIWDLGSGQRAVGHLSKTKDGAVLMLGGMPLSLNLDAQGRIMGGGLNAQQLTIVRTDGVPPKFAKRDYSAPADAHYTAEDVTIPVPGGFTLGATLTRPRASTGPVPVVVTISGSGGQDRDNRISIVKDYASFKQMALAFAERGIGVLRYDDRGVGESGGNANIATTADLADDTRAVLAWLRTRPDVDARNLYLLGHSEGGMIAPMVAASDTLLRGIVLLAGPAYKGQRILEYQGLTRDTMLMKLPWVRFFSDYDPLPVARRVPVPVLVLQGATDRQITADQGQLLADAFRAGGNRDVTLHVLPDVNHLFLKDPDGTAAGYSSLKDSRVPEDVVALIRDWIIQHVK